jgi:hypothetical protein
MPLNFLNTGYFAAKVGIGVNSPFSTLQVGSNTFSGGNGMAADSRVGISNHGILTGMMLASTYNDATSPEYGLVFVQGPSTSSYNVWSISPDGPAKGSGLSFIYKANTTNIHNQTPQVYFEGSTGRVGIGTIGPTEKLDISGTAIVRSTLFTVGNVHGFTSSYGASFFINNGGGNSYFNATGGKVGIGVTGPSEKLDVAGNIKIQSAVLSNQENTDVDTGTETVAEFSAAAFTAGFFDFVIKKGLNVRSGTVYACHDGAGTPLIAFTETSTQDLGDTSDVTLSVDISGGNMRLLATTTSDDWSIKSLIRAI